MNDVNTWQPENAHSNAIPDAKNFTREAKQLCEKALNDAKTQLHPLLRSMDVNRLVGRKDFLQAFKSALEYRIAKRIALWQPAVQAVFKFEETRVADGTDWNSKIHLLAKVPCLSDSLKMFGKKLDTYLLGYLKQMGWSRFKEQRSILELQQVTLNELRHGVSYGAMFHAVYNVPVKVWPAKRAG
jgi:hypothetical protein